MGLKNFKIGFLIHKDLFRGIYHFLPLHVVIRIMIMYDSNLEHYQVGPDGEYLENQGTSDSDNDLAHELDPEPSPGPVDPFLALLF